MSKVRTEVTEVKVVLEMDLAEAQALRAELGEKDGGDRLVSGIYEELYRALNALPTIVKGGDA
jgi:hypothetical protein